MRRLMVDCIMFYYLLYWFELGNLCGGPECGMLVKRSYERTSRILITRSEMNTKQSVHLTLIGLSIVSALAFYGCVLRMFLKARSEK
jgi:hypothetical protein